MKLIKSKNSVSIINYNLLKYQAYNTKKKNCNEFKFNTLNKKLKQVLKIIYLYSIKNKKILFIGFPYNKFLYKNLNESFISINLYKKKISSINVSNYDLILFNQQKSEDVIFLKYFNSLNLPIIVFGNYGKNDYGINCCFYNKKIKKFINFLFFSILSKKAI